MKKKEINSKKLKKPSKKAEHKKSSKKRDKDPHEIINLSVQSFVIENIRVLDYRDIAKFVHIKPDVLKSALGKLGIKVPVESSRKWNKINIGTCRSISDCAQCQIQLHHQTFLVGIRNCRKCYEKNISLWIKEGEDINIFFSEKE